MATDSPDVSPKEELSNSKADGKKEVLPNVDKSPVAPREDLIVTAVHFLQNPRVQKSPFSQKRAFLIKKGLTEVEVDMALDRMAAAGLNSKGGVKPNVPTRPLPIQAHPGEQAIVPWHPGPYVVEHPPTFWQRWREICSSAMVIGATCYGVYYVYKQYLEPALIGKKQIEEDRLDRVERQLLELNKSLSQLRSTLVSVESSLVKQASGHTSASKLDLEQDSSIQDAISLAEIKAEMSSIKALLLSRKQFPATPSPANIPAWQLEQPKDSEQSSSPEETVPKQILQDDEEAVHSVPNGVTVNGDSSADS